MLIRRLTSGTTARAGGLRPRGPDYAGPGNFYEYLRTLRKEGNHGAAFAYKTINTEVLCWVMKRVTGIALPDMLSQRIWSQIGCEEDGLPNGRYHRRGDGGRRIERQSSRLMPFSANS